MMRIQKIFGYSSPQHSWNKGLHFELLGSTLFLEFAQIPGATRSAGPRKSKGQSLNHVFHPMNIYGNMLVNSISSHLEK